MRAAMRTCNEKASPYIVCPRMESNAPHRRHVGGGNAKKKTTKTDKMKNISEILKNAPKGLLLYSPVFGYVNLVGVTDKVGARDKIIASIQFGKSGNVEFDSFGRYRVDGECMLFPSKFHKTWDDWQDCLFNYGDFITNTDGYEETLVISGFDTFITYDANGHKGTISKDEYRWATDGEKIGFLSELYRNGLIWNPLTNEMEIQPKFKVGDTVRIKERKHPEDDYYSEYLDEMLGLAGGVYKVVKVRKQSLPRGNNLVDDDGFVYKLNGLRWNFVSPMLEPVAEKGVSRIDKEPHFLKDGRYYICSEDFYVNPENQDTLFKCGEICHSDQDNTVKNHNGCMFIDGLDGNAEVYFKETDTSNKELAKVKQYAYERWNKLWRTIPDADKEDMTKEDLNNLGRFMEIEQLNEFLDKL